MNNLFNSFNHAFSIKPVDARHIQHVFAAKTNMLAKSGSHPISIWRNEALCLLDAMPFGFLGFIHSFLTDIHTSYQHYEEREQRATFAGVAGALVKADTRAIQSGRLTIQTQYGLLTFDEIRMSGVPQVRMTMDGESFYLDWLPTIASLVSQVNADIILHADDYAEKGITCQLHPNDDLITQYTIRQICPAKIHHSEKAVGGKISDVTKITYTNGNVYFYKPLHPKSHGKAALWAGIPPGKSGKIANRSLFTYIISEYLGFHIIPLTGFTQNEDGELGYVQKKAPGEAAKAVLKKLNTDGCINDLKSNSIITQKTVQLLLLDALVGQVDRHSGNYFVDIDQNEVFGIDNDACGGDNITHPNTMLFSHRADGYLPNKLTPFEAKIVEAMKEAEYPNPDTLTDWQIALIKALRIDDQSKEVDVHKLLKKHHPYTAGRCVPLPPVMDTEMVAKFKNLSYGDLLGQMSPLHFSVDEIKAAFSRLDAIKFHISVLEKRDQLKENQIAGIRSIIRPDEWGTPAVQARLYPKGSGNTMPIYTSYLHREITRSTEAKKYKPPFWSTARINRDHNCLTAADLNKLTQSEYDKFKQDYAASLAKWTTP